MDSPVLLAYVSLVASGTLLQRLLACLNFTLKRFFSLVQTKKMISMNYDSSTSSWKPWRWMRLDLIFSMWHIYINFILNPLTSSNRSTKFKDILPWNISQMITKTILISTRIVICYVMKWGILLWIWWKVNRNWDNTWSECPRWRKSHCRRNTSVRRNKSKRAGPWESQSGIGVAKLTI